MLYLPTYSLQLGGGKGVNPFDLKDSPRELPLGEVLRGIEVGIGMERLYTIGSPDTSEESRLHQRSMRFEEVAERSTSVMRLFLLFLS